MKPAFKRVPTELPPADAILTPEEVAIILDLSVKTVCALCARGDIPARKIGRRWRVLGASLRRALEPSVERAHDNRQSEAIAKRARGSVSPGERGRIRALLVT